MGDLGVWMDVKVALKLQVCKCIVCVCVEGVWGVLGQLEAGVLQQQIVR